MAGGVELGNNNAFGYGGVSILSTVFGLNPTVAETGLSASQNVVITNTLGLPAGENLLINGPNIRRRYRPTAAISHSRNR